MKIQLFSILAVALLATAYPPKKDQFSIPKSTIALSEDIRIAKYEVSQAEYKLFLDALLAQRKTEDAARFQPDTNVWNFRAGEPSAYTSYYWQHPAFTKYPVVGISHAAAEAFCAWMTQTYAHSYSAKQDAENVRYRFRLPTLAEWMQAAGDGKPGHGFYPGGHFYPRDHKGRFLFNHKLGKANFSGWAGDDSKDFEGYGITAPVDAFYPDGMGLYNLSGNVAEMVAEDGIAKGGSWNHLPDDCRMESVQNYEKPESWLGFRVVVERVTVAAGE
jgi:formylglycine-generating enzyme required for sulfatase activity